MSLKTIDPPAVTAEQLDRCTRVIDLDTQTPFYIVESESNPTQQYKVAALRKHGKWYTTCSCPAGLKGIPCKHIRWAKAAAEEYKEELKAQAQRDAEAAVRLALYQQLGIEYTDVDTETLKRIVRRNVKPAPARQCISGRPFSLLK
ncbi:MAG TPA: SWIM zinc finger family protein [Ktedonobacteraceae bacterium]|nr:SWIM zinc finger family protein [Ktedonobacteraceae bacterium]